jgi:LPS sulfotransferase NodH
MKNLLREAFPLNGVLRGATLQAAAGRARLYAIFLTPRVGSTWLTELTMNTGELGCPQEWFNDDWIYTEEPALGCLPPRLRQCLDVNDYVDAIVDEGRGIAGIELSVFQAIMLRELMDTPFDPGWLTAAFYLRRRDLAAQAVSLYRSASSGRFHSYQNAPQAVRAFQALDYDYQSILKWWNFIVESEQRFEALFECCKLSPVELFYEDLQADPLRMLQQIALAVGAKPPQQLPETSLAILRDHRSVAWRDRFLRDLPRDVFDAADRSRALTGGKQRPAELDANAT